MADLVDVEEALKSFVIATLYPNGVISPSITGDAIKIYRGWPIPANLDADLAAGIVNVSIYTQTVERNVTRYTKDWYTFKQPAPLLTVTASGNAVTIGGAIQAGDFAMVKVGLRNAYSAPVVAGSTFASVAAALAAAIVVGFPGTAAAGPVITIPTGAAIAGVVGGTGTSVQVMRQQQRGFQVTAWCSTPAQRDRVGPVIDFAFAGIERLALPDGTSGRLIYEKSWVTDKGQREQCYRRDLTYSVEYPTIATRPDTSIGAVQVNNTGGISPADSPIFTTIT